MENIMMANMRKMMKIGTQGTEGYCWDECGKTDIVQILISHGSSEVNSIQYVYVVNKKLVPSLKHGKPNGAKFDTVTFNYPGEYLVSVSGCTQNGLASITFGTNKRNYGPFGMTGDDSSKDPFEKFNYNFRSKSSFGGFHGRVHKDRVSAIAVYVRPLELLADIEIVNIDSEE